MDKLSPAILDAFGIQSRSIKKEKGHYLCNTDYGLMKVHITYDTPETIWLQYSIKEHLAANGFSYTDRFRLAKTGQPFVQLGRETYIMATLPQQHRETNFENEAEALEAFRALAYFHTASRNMPMDTIPKSQPLTEVYARQMKELTQIGKQVRRNSRLSDFDVLFIKHAQDCGELIQDCIHRLAKTDYAALHAMALNQGSLCHNTLKEENLLVTCKHHNPPSTLNCFITNFSEAEIGLQLWDLAALIRRYAQRSGKDIPVTRLLETYNQISPLPHGAVDILYPLLIFPWAFMKIITQYYSKKRNWTPNGMFNRMETILAERDSYENYISCLQ